MKGSYTWKVLLILAMTAASVVALLPKKEKPVIRLGIDLRGGAELLFQVDTKGLPDDQKTGLTQKTVDIVRERIDPFDQKGLVIQSKGQYRILMQLPGFSREETKDIITLATNLGKLEWRIVSKEQDPTRIQILKQGKSLPNCEYFPYAQSARLQPGGAELPEGFLVDTNDGYNITGELLKRVYPSLDEDGGPAVSFEMKPEGAKRFARMTGEHIGEPIAIILNGEIYSAPYVRSQITTSGQISNMENAKEVDMLVKILNSGSLKAPLVLESEQYVGPAVGENTIKSAISSGIVAAICVLAFMTLYYFFAGVVANLALALNILILMAFMALSQSTLTLPGIAGIILTVGMSVDANVLIFERFREERRLGRELPVALRLGYEKAFSAIFDSNLTTFATAAILYIYGTGPVKGFAITLSAGIIISFFTAVFVTRVIFELLAKEGLIKDLKMMHWLTRPNVAFMNIARYAVVASAILITVGMAIFVDRWNSLLDIDFTGGSVAQLQLTKPLGIEDVRRRVSEAGFPGAQIQALAEKVAVAAPGEARGTESMSKLLGESMVFAVRTKLQAKAAVLDFESKIAAAFADVTNTRTVEVVTQGVRPITAKNDPFFGGLRFDGRLREPLPVSQISSDLAKALVPNKFEAKFYLSDESSGAVTEALPDAEAVYLFGINVLGLDEKALTGALSKAFTLPNPFPDAVSQIGSVVAKEMASDAILAVALSMGFMVVYIWFRFNGLRFGLAAVIALFHDIPVALGALAIADALSGTPIGDALLFNDLKINLPVVAAVLTLLGYSINDTVVVFDRIRENMRLKTKSDWEIIDGSINQTLSRTMLTGVSVIMVLLIMYIFGGPGIHAFTFVMLVGVITGTYSSIFIASPILLIKDIFKGKPITDKARA